MTTRSFDASYRLASLAAPVFAALLAACSSSSFTGAPDGATDDLDASKPHVTHDAAAVDDAPRATADAAHPAKDGAISLDATNALDSAATAPDAGHAVDAGHPFDAAHALDASHPFDVAVPPVDASHPLDAHLTFPDASGPIEACESCLESTCGADAEKCEDDPNCTAAIDCAITTGCLAPGDAGGVEACVDACIKNEGLTPHEQAAVVQEIAALASCATPCVSSCAPRDGGSSS